MNDRTQQIQHLLVIDDEKFDQMIYQRVIERSGLVKKSRCFYNARDALDYLRSPDAEPVDAILLDINMPGLNGFEFVERASAEFGEEFARALVVLLTTSLNEEDIQRAGQYSVIKGYLHKPLVADHLDWLVQIIQGDETPRDFNLLGRVPAAN